AARQAAHATSAMPHMEALGRTVGENVCLAVRDGIESETAAVFQPSSNLRRYTTKGQRRPLHAGPGRLLLAYAPEAVQAQALAMRLPRYTPTTPTDPKGIAGDLPRLRNRGYLITSEEVSAGAVSVTVPVRDATAEV